MTRHLLTIITAFILAASLMGNSGEEFEKYIQPYMQKHCISCHGPEKQKGDFRIDTLSADVGQVDTPYWAEIMDRISSGEMPPEKVKERPSAEKSAEIVEWLAARIKEGEEARLAKRAPVTLYKLSREEYANTLYDLLGVRYNPEDPGGLTEDDEWNGFDRIGSVLTLSPSHVEKYLTAAESVLNEAFPEKEQESVISRKTALDLQGGPSKEEIAELEELGLKDKVRVDMWPGHLIQGGRPGPADRNMFKNGGTYKVRVKLSGLKPKNGRAPHLEFAADKLDRVLFESDIIAPEDEPVVVEFQTHLPPGSHTFRVRNDVPGPSVLPRSGRSGNKAFLSIKDGRIPWQLKLTDDEGLPLYPFLIIDWIEWEGPIITDAERELRKNYIPQKDGNFTQVRECLENFATRAFRRPITKQEIDKLEALVKNEMEAGSKFFDAVKTAYLAILSSKSFYYLVEGNPESPSNRLNDYELASRLSYFLWSTMPDRQLFELAATNKLSNPEVLKEQIGRMLKDPKGERFLETFPKQWLQLNKVGMFPPDSMLYPEYDMWLEKSMIQECVHYFRHVFENQLTLHEFIDSDWTFLNPRLAQHYAIEPPVGDNWEKVALKKEYNRGGLLTQGAILSLTSDGQRHRPVHRGIWVSEVILGKTPPPPPANVDPIEPNPTDKPKATIRDKLKAHVHDPNCAACHKKIDPLGFAFDNYDAIGRWRTTEKVPTGTGADPKVDASGELPDGRQFTGPEHFKKLLLEDIDSFAHAFIEKLATYGLRRTMTINDRDDMKELAHQAKTGGYQVSKIVEQFILSDLFHNR
jgi:hypothetical protein